MDGWIWGRKAMSYIFIQTRSSSSTKKHRLRNVYTCSDSGMAGLVYKKAGS